MNEYANEAGITHSGIVGVAGLLLQGGISFLSAQYGLAADVSFVATQTALLDS